MSWSIDDTPPPPVGSFRLRAEIALQASELSTLRARVAELETRAEAAERYHSDALTVQVLEGKEHSARVAELEAALIAAKEWLDELGCDCGTDEPGTCALCLVDAALAKAVPRG